MNTTLNEIKIYNPCIEGWKKLLDSLNKTSADDEPLSFAHILKSNGIKDAVWSLRVLPLKDQALFRADVAESVLHLFESKYPSDTRPRKCIEVLRLFARGEISDRDLGKTAAAAYDAYAAIRASYTDATYAAHAAYAAHSVHSTYFVDRIYKWQEIEKLFIKHFCGE